MLDAGLRLSELSTLEESDVHIDDQYAKVMGKGSKERIVAFGVACQKALLSYYYQHRVAPAHSAITSFFLSIDGYPLTSEAIKALCDDWRSRRQCPASTRICCATPMLRCSFSMGATSSS